MEKFIQNLEEAERIIRTVDHLIYVTFPLIKDKRMLIKILVETKNALVYFINAILQYDYMYKRIQLYQDPTQNFRTFKDKSSKRYGITEQEMAQIISLFNIVEAHKKSPMEFTRGDKIVIMTENFKPETINQEKVKEFINTSKEIFKKFKDFLKTRE